MLVGNVGGFLGLETPKCAVSQEGIDEMSWFFSCWYKFKKAKSCFNNYWVDMVKNEWDLLDHGTLKSGVSRKWFDELSILIEWFLPSDSDGIILVQWPAQSTLYLLHLNGGAPLQLYLARFFRKNFLWAKMTPK